MFLCGIDTQNVNEANYQKNEILNIKNQRIIGKIDLTKYKKEHHITDLKYVNCSNNNITEIKLVNEIEYLDCSLNNITELKLIHCVKLRHINLKLNPLSILEFNFEYNYDLPELPDSLTTLKLGVHFNQPLNYKTKKSKIIKNKLPENLKKLYISYYYDHPLNNLPENLELLSLDGIFNKSLNNLPQKLKKIILSNEFNKTLKYIPQSVRIIKTQNLYNNEFIDIPDFIEEIYFGDRYNIKVDNLPKNLKILYLGNNFNQSIDNLPFGLEKLVIRGNFNKPINNLPTSLKILILVKEFNQLIDYLPESINVLELGKKFDKPIDNLPNSIEKLTLGEHFNQPIDNLPNSIKNLIIKSCIFDKIVNKLPLNLENLIFNDYINFDLNFTIKNFPPNLKKIIMPKKYSNEFLNFPLSITHLTLSNDYNKNISYLPNIEEITIKNANQYFLFDVSNRDSITKFDLDKIYDTKMLLEQLLLIPKTIKHLILPIFDGFSLEKHIPNYINKITFSSFYVLDFKIDKNLPTNVKSIELNKKIFFGIYMNNLPDTLEEIILDLEIQKIKIPKKYHHLIKYNNETQY